MLEGYGLYQLTWDTCDERFGDVLVASSADAGGRGISLTVRQNGAVANLTGGTVYFVWCHKVTGERGTEPFSAIDASAGTFEVYYPAAMQDAEGAVQAQVMVSRGGDTYISSRVFTIHVEPVVIGGEEHQDGFTLFVDAINAYELGRTSQAAGHPGSPGRDWTAGRDRCDWCNGATRPEGRHGQRRRGRDHRRVGNPELQLLVQCVFELHRGAGFREPVRNDECRPDVLHLRLFGDNTRSGRYLRAGVMGSQCFYSCSTSLVGGNGTVWASVYAGLCR